MPDQLEGRNPVVEALRRARRRVHHVWLDQGARHDPRIAELIELAARAGVPLERVDRRILDRKADGRVHNGVIASVEELPHWTMASLLDHLAGTDPFLVVVHELAYEHNLGAILRSALGFGVNGLVLPSRRGASIQSPVVQRVAMGAAEEIPVVREGLHGALKSISRAGIPIVGADMGGEPAHRVDLRGPLALLLGGEGSGIPTGLAGKCDRIVSIPLAGNLESLNVSVAAAVLMYEKRRQEA